MGRIPDEDVDKVREASDIVSVVSETVQLRRKGKLYWGLCPFHGEKTPSFKVDPATQLWHCFGCGQGGDVFGFVMRTESLEFPDAVRQLADRAHVEIREEGGGLARSAKERLMEACEATAEYYHRLLTTSRDAGASGAREYLRSRGFGIETAKRFRLGWAPKALDGLTRHLLSAGFTAEELVSANLAVRDDRRGGVKDRFFGRVMFPIADLNGRVIAFGGRVVGEGQPKYLNSSDTPIFHKSANLYGIDRARNEIVRGGGAIVVEGYTDVIALAEAGIGNVVATLGTSLTPQHVKLLGRFASRVVYLFDGDEAGLRAADRAGGFLDWRSTPEAGEARMELDVAVIPSGQDPADFVAAEGADAMRHLVGGAVPLLRFILDRRLDAHDLARPEGRAAALASAAKVLAGLKGSILAHDYAEHVAHRLLVDSDTVRRAVESAKPDLVLASGGEASGSEEVRSVLPPRPRMHDPSETEFLRILVLCPEARGEARELLDSGLMADEWLAALAVRVVDSGSATGQALFAHVSAEEEEASELLSGWLVDQNRPTELTYVFRRLLLELTERGLERKRLSLRGSMRSAETAGDSKELDRLFRETAAVDKRLSDVRTRLFSARSDERDHGNRNQDGVT